jgi:hypothetical protein
MIYETYCQESHFKIEASYESLGKRLWCYSEVPAEEGKCDDFDVAVLECKGKMGGGALSVPSWYV